MCEPKLCKSVILGRCRKRFNQKGVYPLENRTVIIGFCVYLTYKRLPFLLHGNIITKAHDLFKMLHGKVAFTVCKGLSERLGKYLSDKRPENPIRLRIASSSSAMVVSTEYYAFPVLEQ